MSLLLLLNTASGGGGNPELLLDGDDFSTSNWTEIGCAVTGGETDPLSGTDAYLLTSSGTGRLRQVVTLEIGSDYRLQGTIKAKNNDITNANIYAQDNGSPFSTTTFRTGAITVAEGFVTIDSTVTMGGSLTSKRFDIDVGTTDELILYNFSLKKV